MSWVRGNYLDVGAQLGVGSAGVRLAALGPHPQFKTIITKGIHYSRREGRKAEGKGAARIAHLLAL